MSEKPVRLWGIGLAFVLILPALAGCVESSVRTSDVKISVIDAQDIQQQAKPPACPTLTGGLLKDAHMGVCHVFEVKVANTGDGPLPLEAETVHETFSGLEYHTNWYGVTETGEQVKADRLAGPETLPGQSNRTVEVAIATEKVVKIEELRYQTREMNHPASASVPAYEVDPWEPKVSFDIADAWATDVGCEATIFDGSALETENINEIECHAFRIHVENNRGSDSWRHDFAERAKPGSDVDKFFDLTLNARAWTVSVDGDQETNIYALEGEETIPAGEEGNVTLHVDTWPDTNIQALAWQGDVFPGVKKPDPVVLKPPAYEVEPWEIPVTMTVTNVSTVGTDEYEGAGDNEYRLTAHIVNDYEPLVLDTHLVWSVRASNGEVIPVDAAGGDPEGVDPGEEVNKTVRVDLPDGTSPEALLYQDRWMPRPIEAAASFE